MIENLPLLYILNTLGQLPQAIPNPLLNARKKPNMLKLEVKIQAFYRKSLARAQQKGTIEEDLQET